MFEMAGTAERIKKRREIKEKTYSKERKERKGRGVEKDIKGR